MSSQKQKVLFVKQEVPTPFSWGHSALLSAANAIVGLCVGALGAYKLSQAHHQLTTDKLDDFVTRTAEARIVDSTRAIPVWLRLVTPGQTNFYNLSDQFNNRLDLDIRSASQITTFFGKAPSEITNSAWYDNYSKFKMAGYNCVNGIWWKTE